MKLKLSLALLLLLAAVLPAGAAELEIPNNAVVSGTVTATSFICANSLVPCIDPLSISAGTGGFSISGSAASALTAFSVTDGVYTTGSYADPFWLTSLDGSKIAGNISGNVGYATTASSVINGVYTTGSYADPAWLGSLSISKILGIITPAKIGFYDKVGIVAKTGGDYDDPAVAMSNYGSWCGTPSATNRCLLKIMPGVYTVTSPVMMMAFIDIEGSGQKVTKITSSLSNATAPSDGAPPAVATVMAQSFLNYDFAEIRYLTIENTGTGSYTAAMVNYYAWPSLAHVTVLANGAGGANHYGIFSNQCKDVPTRDVSVHASGGAYNYGIYLLKAGSTISNVTSTATGGPGSQNYGIYIYNELSPSFPSVLTNVTATASGGTYSYGFYNVEFAKPKLYRVTAAASGATYAYGIFNWNSSPAMTAVTATGTYGIMNFWSGGAAPTVKITNSIIKGVQNSIYNRSGVTTYVGNTQLDGTAYTEVASSTALTCVGAYSGVYAALNNQCK